MPNRFIFSLRFSSKVFLRLTALSMALVIFMTLFRVNLYFLSVFHATADAVFVDVIQSLVAGLRFDILIFGFLMAPLYLLMMIEAALEKWPQGLLSLYKFYYALAWSFICLLTYLDFFHFARFGKRMRWAEYQSLSLDSILSNVESLQRHQIVIFSIITVLLLMLGLMLIKALKFGEWKDEFSPIAGSRLEVMIRIWAPALLIALAARGTVSPHHLNIEHSQVSSFEVINEMALNPPWCLDK